MRGHQGHYSELPSILILHYVPEGPSCTLLLLTVRILAMTFGWNMESENIYLDIHSSPTNPKSYGFQFVGSVMNVTLSKMESGWAEMVKW